MRARSRVRPARAAALLLVAALSAAGAVACGGSRGGDAGPSSILLVRAPVADAVLWVDGRHVGQLRDLKGGVRLAPGPHQIEVRHDSYHAYYGEVELAAGQRFQLDVELAERFP
ncbi:MAG TPA: PEGA domain-containing protein [Kofleriaceae bacterium]|nr:PEGA domain-containing protein [Kofleriaceae bacterium]